MQQFLSILLLLFFHSPNQACQSSGNSSQQDVITPEPAILSPGMTLSLITPQDLPRSSPYLNFAEEETVESLLSNLNEVPEHYQKSFSCGLDQNTSKPSMSKVREALLRLKSEDPPSSSSFSNISLPSSPPLTEENLIQHNALHGFKAACDRSSSISSATTIDERVSASPTEDDRSKKLVVKWMPLGIKRQKKQQARPGKD